MRGESHLQPKRTVWIACVALCFGVSACATRGNVERAAVAPASAPPSAVAAPASSASPAAFEILREKANRLEAAGQRAGALEILRVLSSLDPGDQELEARVLRLLESFEHWEEVAALCRRALGARPHETSLHLRLGTALWRLGSALEAHDPLVTACELEPENPEARLQLAEVLIELEQWQDAEDALRRVLTLDPEQPALHQRLGFVLLSGGDAQEAAGELEAAQRLAPTQATATLLGVAYMRLGRAEEALAIFDRIMSGDDPDGEGRANLHFQRGLALLLLDRKEEARGAFERALELDPEHPTAAAALLRVGR